MRTLAIAALLLAFSACTKKREEAQALAQQHADIRLICDRYTEWEKDEDFVKAEPMEKYQAVVDLFEDEVKSVKVRDAIANSTLMAPDAQKSIMANKVFYELAPKGFSCPAWDRAYPLEEME